MNTRVCAPSDVLIGEGYFVEPGPFAPKTNFYPEEYCAVALRIECERAVAKWKAKKGARWTVQAPRLSRAGVCICVLAVALSLLGVFALVRP